jgi:CRP-like cAMP-binding protein
MPGIDAVDRGGQRASSRFLDRLDEDDREALLALGTQKRFRRAATVFNEGDRSTHVLVCLGGLVKISYFTEDGREVVLAVREADGLLGELSALDGEPRSATVTAVEPVDAIVISAADFVAFLEQHPRVTLFILTTAVRRWRDADRKRIEFVANDIVGRVAVELLDFADRFGIAGADGTRMSFKFSQQELAGLVGASREAVSKALRTLRATGCIEVGRQQIVITDKAKLKRRVA